jgi:hypothetical protein
MRVYVCRVWCGNSIFGKLSGTWQVEWNGKIEGMKGNEWCDLWRHQLSHGDDHVGVFLITMFTPASAQL